LRTNWCITWSPPVRSRWFFEHSPDAYTIAAFCLSLVMAFLIGFLLECLIGLISFWFLEVSSLVFIFMMLNYFLSGHMIPLDWVSNWLARLLPESVSGLSQVVLYTPFQYLAYFPAAIMLGRFPRADLATHLAAEFAWVLVLLALNRLMYARGVRQYSAFGG
jgi:ABC-2 type transport system permease protein